MRDCEVWDFVLKNYYGLRFSPAVEAAVKDGRVNPKRRQTMQAGIGTKSQQALQLQREARKERQELCNNIPKYHTDKSEWIVAEDTHEPVVDREMFFRVQGILEENYLKGYMRCGHCGKTFNLSQAKRFRMSG